MQQQFPSLLRRVWNHVGARRRVQIGLLLFLMIVVSFAEVISISAVVPFLGVLSAPEKVFEHPLAQPIIEALAVTEARQLLLPFTIFFSVAVLFSGAMRLILLWGQTKTSHAIGADFSISIYRRTLFQPYTVHLTRNSSDVIAGITGKASALVNNTLLPVLTILSSIIMLVAILFTLISIDPIISLSAFSGFGIIYLVVIYLTKKGLARDSQHISRESGRVIKALQEGLGGIRDVLIDGAQDVYCNTYRNADIPLRRAQANIQLISGSPRYGIEALAMVLIAVLAYSIADQSESIAHTIPVLGAFALGSQRLLPVLQQIYVSMAAMRGGQSSLSDALDLLDQPLPEHANKPLPAPIKFQECITLANIKFRYTTQSPWVIDGLELVMRKGSKIGFKGCTGSGKSTLLDIIMGLLTPSEGSLTIDGVVINKDNNRSWQAHIAHVPQSIFLSDATVAENIALGVPPDQIDHARVRQAAEKAQIAQVIESWAEQYHTMVGEGGVRLSGGQRQRIGIARALYKRADVIVLDEATSALDNETEGAVMSAIDGLGKEFTILIVAHRLSTLKNCTQVVELDQGRISRIETYSQDISVVI